MTLPEYLDLMGRGALKDLATDVGCGTSHLSHISKGKRVPSPELAGKIHRATAGMVSALELLGLADLIEGSDGPAKTKETQDG